MLESLKIKWNHVHALFKRTTKLQHNNYYLHRKPLKEKENVSRFSKKLNIYMQCIKLYFAIQKNSWQLYSYNAIGLYLLNSLYLFFKVKHQHFLVNSTEHKHRTFHVPVYLLKIIQVKLWFVLYGSDPFQLGESECFL